MTVGRLAAAWAATTVVYAVVFTAGMVLFGVVDERGAGGDWLLAPIAGAPGLVVGVLVVGRRAAARSPRWVGLAAVSVPALAVLGCYLAFVLTPSNLVVFTAWTLFLALVVPPAVLLATGAAAGLRAHPRWSRGRPSYTQAVR